MRVVQTLVQVVVALPASLQPQLVCVQMQAQSQDLMEFQLIKILMAQMGLLMNDLPKVT
jgi:hypothetical protein